MMQQISKWKVKVNRGNGQFTMFWVSDNFLSNVLRDVAKMDFSGNIEQPISIEITNEAGQIQNAITTMTTAQTPFENGGLRK